MVATACKRPRKPRVATGSIEICQLPFQNGSIVNLRYMLPNPKYNSINHDSIALHPRTIYTSDLCRLVSTPVKPRWKRKPMLNYSLYGTCLNAPPAGPRALTGGLFGKPFRARQYQISRDARCGGSRRDRQNRRTEETVHPQAEPLGSILCVEHEQETAAPLAETLIDLGCTVDVAHDGEVGLAKILANRPDLILCNASVPRIGGLELLQKLSRAGADFRKVQFILLTEGLCRDNELAARRLGADECLPKPVDLEMLSVVVKKPASEYPS